MNDLVKPPTMPMTTIDLANAIKTEIANIEAVGRKAKTDMIGHALKCGGLLLQAKERVGHGKFGEWVYKHCKLSERTAQRYMQIKGEWPKIERWMKENSASVADLTLTKAAQLTAPASADKGDQAVRGTVVISTGEVLPPDPATKLTDQLVTALKALRDTDALRARQSVAELIKLLKAADLFEAA